ncbi:MAG: EAL domain-containing protein [Pontixanthobacter sp.]
MQTVRPQATADAQYCGGDRPARMVDAATHPLGGRRADPAAGEVADRTGEPDARLEVRRSVLPRRQQIARKKRMPPAEVRRKRHIVPGSWWFIAYAFILSFLMSAFLSRSFPSTPILLCVFIGLGFVSWSRSVAQIERTDPDASRWWKVAAWACVVVPIATYSVSQVLWVTDAGLAVPWLVSGMVVFNVLGFNLLIERPLQQAFCISVSWGIVALAVGTADAMGAFVALICFSAAIGRYQAQVNASRCEAAQARERKRNRAEDILRDYEETGQGWFWETDRRGTVSYLSQSIVAILDRTEEELIGKPFLELFDLGDDNQEGERTLSFHLSARSSFQELGVRAATKGEERWWSVNGRPAYDNFHNFVGFRGSGTDLTEKRRSEASVTRLAQYDSLTGLANRFQMQQTLDKILHAPQLHQRECSVLLLDLDRFKHVNDTFGHPAGDALLKQVAQRLERAVGSDGRVGRLGGDEFKVIIVGRTDRDALAHLAQQIIHSLSQPYSIEGQRAVIGASIGIATAPENGVTGEAIIRNCDLALYAAKDGGRGRYHFYSNDLHTAAEERSRMEQDLRDAIAKGDLQLFYQPVVHAQGDRIAGFEALLRWNHPTKGWMSPAKFIPIAEDTGLIAAIGEWAIRTCCDDLARWPEHIRCAVNVSPLQFANPQLPSIITSAIACAEIHPSRLELEITESVFLNDDAGTDAMFAALKRVGVRLALDDFGTGYSSLGYLKKAPFDKIKIDQSFVRGATKPGSRNGAIITSITSLAKSLGMDTTAEGVETLDELELVRSLGCSHVQGYIYSKAVEVTRATAIVRASAVLPAQGPRSARPRRHKLLRTIVVETGGELYEGTIRDIAVGGAVIEGLWNVPVGTPLAIAITDDLMIKATSVWGDENRVGVQFAQPIDLEKARFAGSNVAPMELHRQA